MATSTMASAGDVGAERATALRILLVGTLETGGGAAAIASGLHRGYQARGHVSWRAVGQKASSDPAVIEIPDDDRPAFRAIGYTAVQHQLRRLA